jgi:hypothetical protein
MSIRIRLLLTGVLLLTALAASADKKKNLLPATVLKARTVLVLIDPDAGISVSHPAANKTARDDVEKAIMKWGRLLPVLDGQNPDLVIVVREGQGKLVEPTIGGVPNDNDRPVVFEPTDNGIRVGGQRGRPPDAAQGAQHDTGARPKVEAGPREDMLVVYAGGMDYPLDHPPLWRYIAKDALRSPDVPAVAEFRKLLEETENREKSQP